MIKHALYCDGSITIMWSLNVLINDITKPCRQVKKQFCQVIRVRPIHNLKELQLSSDVTCHHILL